MMISGCKYCKSESCWGHSNDEKSALDLAADYKSQRDALQAEVERLTIEKAAFVSEFDKKWEELKSQRDAALVDIERLKTNNAKLTEAANHFDTENDRLREEVERLNARLKQWEEQDIHEAMQCYQDTKRMREALEAVWHEGVCAGRLKDKVAAALEHTLVQTQSACDHWVGNGLDCTKCGAKINPYKNVQTQLEEKNRE